MFSKKFQHICVSINVNFKESLINNMVSFEQLDPDHSEGAFSQTDVDKIITKLLLGLTANS